MFVSASDVEDAIKWDLGFRDATDAITSVGRARVRAVKARGSVL